MVFETILISLLAGSLILNIHMITRSTCGCSSCMMDIDIHESKKESEQLVQR